jgi:hypothetical protein
MRKRGDYRLLFLIAGLTASLHSLQAQQPFRTRIGSTISYISGSTIYIAAGRQRGLAVGDTAVVWQKGIPGPRAVIAAVSSSSSSAQLTGVGQPVSIGDSVVVEKSVLPEESLVQSTTTSMGPRTVTGMTGPTVHGRAAVQFVGGGPTNGSWTFAQPSVLLHLQIERLFGEGFSFLMYGRSTYDMSQSYQWAPGGRRLNLRMYEMSLTYDNPSSWYGMSAGRLLPRYVYGLGATDGVQATARKGNVVAGFVGGSQPDYRTSGVDPERQKIAAFVNIGWGGDLFGPGDITFAYGQQMYKGRLDRDFLYTQSSLSIASRLYLYQSTELDLHKLDSGVRVHTLQLTNSFVTLNYVATDWLSVNGGMDATRPLTLLASETPDSLLNKDLQKGVRGGVNIRLPWHIVAFGTANHRFATSSISSSESYGGGFRLSDIGGSGFNTGIQVLRTRSLYTQGNDLAANLDRWIGGILSASLRFDRYEYRQTSSEIKTTVSTLSGNFTLMPGRTWYMVGGVDRVWEGVNNSFRVFAEIGYHF